MIVIDPGHGGGAATGNSSPYGLRGPNGTHEKDVTLALARRVAAFLGRDVVLTRSGDVNLSLEDRAALAQRVGASHFVSIHAGSGRGRQTQAWVHGSAGEPSRSLARAIHDELVAEGQPAGGVREADMGVLRPSWLAYGTAACLVEVDDIASAPAEGMLRDPQQLDRMARAIARGIQRTHGYGAPVASAMRVAPYNPSSADEAVREITRWSQDLSTFLAGVPHAAHAWWPHNAICKLYIRTASGSGAATGYFVAPDRLVTNAHVTSPATEIRIAPGEAEHTPANTVVVNRASQIVTHPSWTGSSSRRRKYDIGVVKLTTSQARTAAISRPIPMWVMNQSVRSGLSVVGYASRIRPEDAQRWQLSASINPNVQHASHGPGGAASDFETINYHIQALAGSSGAPVLFAHDDGSLRAVGVHSGSDGDPLHNVGTAFTDAKIRWIRSA